MLEQSPVEIPPSRSSPTRRGVWPERSATLAVYLQLRGRLKLSVLRRGDESEVLLMMVDPPLTVGAVIALPVRIEPSTEELRTIRGPRCLSRSTLLGKPGGSSSGGTISGGDGIEVSS